MHKKNISGFTLLEIMVVIFLIALASSMATPHVKRYIKDRQKREFIQDLFGLVSAIRSYNLIHNDWPVDTAENQLPGAFAPFLPDKFRLPVDGNGIINISTVRPFSFSSADGGNGAWDYDNWFQNSSQGIRIGIRRPDARLGNQELNELIASLNDGTNAIFYGIPSGAQNRLQYIFREASTSEPGP